MKKMLSVFLSLLFVTFLMLPCFASDAENRIYSEVITVENENKITIPVKIENNTGFMGFMIYVDYDDELLEPVSAVKGESLNGMFNDSIETSNDNSFRIVYSGSENMTGDMTLFELEFNVLDHEDNSTSIGLTYSQADTFDENWNDVVFACEDIDVQIGNGAKVLHKIEWYAGETLYKTTNAYAGETIVPPEAPACDGYEFDGWDNIPDTMPESDIVIHAVFKPVESPASAEILKSGYLSSTKFDYKTTFVLYAQTTAAYDKIEWYVDGKSAGAGENIRLEEVKADFEIYCSVKCDDGTVIETEPLKIEINNSIWAKIITFFRMIFKALPVVDNSEVV